ncbi:Uma2 family endonuclease [Persephonella sp.]
MPALAEKKKAKTTGEKKKGRPKIPDYLVYEILGNKKIYYRDYKKVLSGELPPEAVMGSSDLQAWIISTVVEFLIKSLPKKYKLLFNEVGYFYTPSRSKKWLNLDIAIVSRKKLGKPVGTYLKIPPEVVIEVDTKADLEKFGSEMDYFLKKTETLLESSVKKVIWIFTKEKKLLVGEKGKRWFITNWDDNIDLIEDIKLNLHQLLKEESGE